MDLKGLLEVLEAGRVDYVVVGGVAAYLHGSARLTVDLDIVYDRAPENIARLVKALAPLSPRLRGAPEGLPFRLDERTVRAGLNFTLETTLGHLDILGEVTGGGGYEALLPHSVEAHAFGFRLRCVSLPALIRLKRSAGRQKDLEAIAELEILREEE